MWTAALEIGEERDVDNTVVREAGVTKGSAAEDEAYVTGIHGGLWRDERDNGRVRKPRDKPVDGITRDVGDR